MRATLMYAPGDVRVEDVAEPSIEQPTDAIIRTVATCICGSDLHPYRSIEPTEEGSPMGHESLGVVEELGSEVTGLAKGDLVIAPFGYCDYTCDYCREGVSTACVNGGFMSTCQAEYVRIPQAAGSLVTVPGGETGVDDALLPSLLTLSDVYATGWHAASMAGVTESTTVSVIGDGAVGLLAVLSAKQMGAERIILMGRHEARTDLGREFGATDVVAERGEEGIAAVKELTNGQGTHCVLEAVGHLPAYEQAVGVVRPGGIISRVGVPQYGKGQIGWPVFGRNIRLAGGPAPVRNYIEELLPAVLDGTVDPGRVFDRTVGFDEIPDGYRAMDSREALKVLVRP